MTAGAPPRELVERWVATRLTQRGSSNGSPRVLGLAARPSWSSVTTTIGNSTVHLRVCESPIDVREALANASNDAEVTVILTGCPESILGSDVRARLDGRKLHAIKPLDLAKQLLKVSTVESRLARNSTLLAELVNAAPREGWPAEPTKTLTFDRAVELLLEQRAQLAGATRGGMNQLFEWIEQGGAQRLDELDSAVREQLEEWLVAKHGAAARLGLQLAQAGHAHELVAHALAAGLISDPDLDLQTRERARARLETRIGGEHLRDSQLDAWSLAAERYVRKRVADGQAIASIIPGSRDVLDHLGLAECVGTSEVLPEGHVARLRAIARLVTQTVEQRSEQSLKLLWEAVRFADQHVLATQSTQSLRRDQIRALARLCSWLVRAPEPNMHTASAAIAWYVADGSFVDQLRDALHRADLGDPELNSAVAHLLEAVVDRRERLSESFALAVRDRITTPPLSDGDGIPGVEDVLTTVVPGIAQHARVLVLVIDGMSWSVWHQLRDSIESRGWDVVVPAAGATTAAALATIPSATAMSRTSLLTGSLRSGTAADEQKGFAGLSSLVAASATGEKPSAQRLLHKQDLRDPESGALATSAREVISGIETRIVGVVINVIDDLLAKADQARLSFTTDLMPVVEAVLDAAADAGRAVLVTSDHGHILERGTTYVDGGPYHGERWRAAGDPVEGEISASGKRVLAAGGSVCAPWSERIRYAKGTSRGYHGGITPQEIVVPAVVLAPTGAELPGFAPAGVTWPAWWMSDATEPKSPVGSTVAAPPTPAVTSADDRLFDVNKPETPKQPTVSWITRLVESDRFATQLGAARRVAASPDHVTAILTLIDARGGSAPLSLVAEAAGVAPVRAGGLLAAVRRLLTIDGIDVLDVDRSSNTVAINMPLLRTQFGVDDAK